MTLRSIKPAGGDDFLLELARGNDSAGHTVTVNARPPDVAVPDLWQEVFRRNIRRALLLQGVGVDTASRDRIVRQCLADAKLRNTLVGKNGAWATAGMAGERGLSKIRSWGVTVEQPAPETTSSPPGASGPQPAKQKKSGYDALIKASAGAPTGKNKPAPAPAPVDRQPQDATKQNEWLKWVLGIIILASLLGGLYLAFGDGGTAPPGPTTPSPVPQEQMEAKVNELMNNWQNCVRTAQGQSLKEVMEPTDYEIQRRLCKQKMEDIVLKLGVESDSIPLSAQGWFRDQLPVYSTFFPGEAVLSC